ncbi:hypothetical protein Q8A64_08430 [Oxalobacteraceae bacterium R-40]|uniref:Uncharacterized protein n=1 Tax=Keguizhuia sedimenti TaxID=3064264 RepID=A0ABU1BR05_9BURK|nr:hypothetical protein [Oxalobacteraceae bacterium R-40]
MQTKTRILVAAAPGSVEPIVEAMDDRFELDFFSAMAQAVSYSYANIDVIICDMYFDESRMYNLLRFAKMDFVARNTPFICINTTEGSLSKTMGQGITIACKALGAVGFVDLCGWKRELGKDQAHLKLQMLIDQFAKDKGCSL